MSNSISFKKSKIFALEIIKLYKFLTDTQKEYILSKQILRSGTSIGANLSEAECAISKADFLSKIYIALKEACETQYWLGLLKDSEYINQQTFDLLQPKCNELIKLLTKTTKTLSSK